MNQRPRQTISYLTRRFAEVGLSPDSRKGQNFLIDLNLIDLLAQSAGLTGDDIALEVGSGTGSLTGRLAASARHVITVEIDRHLYQLAREELEGITNVTMLQQDALKNKNRLHPKLVETVQSFVDQEFEGRFILAANLPYSIATPLISNLLLSEIVPDAMAVTIQKELADRLVARPSTKDYGALSIWVQSICDVEIVRVMAPSVFWPRPKVHSAIVRIDHRPEKRQLIPDIPFWHQFVRSMFFHRRKFLRSVSISAFKEQLEKSDVDAVFAEMNFGADTRAEQLDVSTMLELCERFRQRVQQRQ